MDRRSLSFAESSNFFSRLIGLSAARRFKKPRTSHGRTTSTSRTEAIVEAVDKAFGTGSHFADIKKQGWKAMNSYTHGGLLQLTRRFSGTRVEPNYKDGEIENLTPLRFLTLLFF